MIRIYIPTNVENRILTAVKHRAADEFGGFTVFSSDGGWVDDNGELIEETVNVIEVENASENWAASTAQWIADKSGEDSVMWQHVDSTVGFKQ